MTHLLGIDLGTSSVKVLITDEKGSILGRGSAEYPLLMPHPGRVEQDPAVWWQAAVLAFQRARGEMKAKPGISAISFCGQMHGTVVLDESNQLLQPAVIWPDQRSHHQVKEITRLVGRERLLEITGSLCATGFQAATLRWMQQNQEQAWAHTRQVLLPKDYLRWRMCGEFGTDPSDAAGTGLLDGKLRTWSQELLDGLQMDAQLFPPILPSSAQPGRLQSRAAQELGLPEGIPVVVGAADTAASLLGAGTTAAGSLLVTISTGGQLIAPLNSFVVDRRGGLHTFCSAVEPEHNLAGWYLMGATLSAGQSMRWLRENVLKLSSSEGYVQVNAWADQAAVGAEGLFFLPYLAGERADSQVPGAFLGLTIRHGKAELARAVMEGVVYSLYEKYLLMADQGVDPGQIILAGGGARTSLWTQIVADVFGLPVKRVLVEEQSAYGAAKLAGIGIGLFNIAEFCGDWERLSGQIEPDGKSSAQYRELFPIYQQIQRKMRSITERES